MENKNINFDLLISKKENAEAYKVGIEDIEKEIKDIQQRINLSMITEEKDLLNKEKEQKEEEMENLKSIYDSKKETIEAEIDLAKEHLLQEIEKIEVRLISKEESNKLKEERDKKEEELLECEKDIKEVKEELKDLIDKDGGYEQDTVSLSKKLDNLTAYKAYINEEIDEINGKLENTIVTEEYIEEIKYVKYMKMRLANLSYNSLEKWKEEEEKSQEELRNKESELDPIEQEAEETEPEKTEPIKTEPEKTEPEKTEPAKTEPVKTEPEKTEPAKTEPVKTKPVKKESVKSEEKPRQNTEKEWELTNIDVLPIENKMIYRSRNKDNVFDKNEDEFKRDLEYDEGKIEEQLSVLKRYFKDYDMEKIKNAIDPNIISFLAENSTKFNDGIKSYLDMLSGKESRLTLKYSLKDIYKSDFNREEIKKIFKIARTAKKLSKDSVEVDKDNIFVRAFGNVRKMLSEYNQKRIDAPKDEEKGKRKIKGVNKVKEFFTKEPKMISKIKDLGSKAYNGVKTKIADSRKTFAKKLKIDKAPLKGNVRNNEHIEQLPERNQYDMFIGIDEDYWRE